MSTITRNKKARFNYEILEEIEAGIVLFGSEVKALREGRCDMTDCHASISKDFELFATGITIQKYNQASAFAKNIDPERNRKLLIKKKEIARLNDKIKQKGLTIVPLSIYFNSRNLVKVKIGLCKGKKIHEKKQAIKERDITIQAKRDIKNFQ